MSPEREALRRAFLRLADRGGETPFELALRIAEHNALRMRERAAEQVLPGIERACIMRLEPELEMPPEVGT